MTKPVKRSEFIAADTNEQADFIAQDNVDAAIRYLRAADAAMKSLGARPNRGSLYRTTQLELKGLRRLAVPGFKNYLIFSMTAPATWKLSVSFTPPGTFQRFSPESKH